ncbi:hypothetical protein [Streptomyces acidiscabies]|uniref:hypothetical protein n=1 Tax=Streptomyces acidiscabies TaxID=42234 RepID=UPI00073ECFC5|nr:hypothetical protein [Streptomyces acidiscabies]GAQ52110.1 hypothetical protein a10_01891 [Streptomyces acidiscabies]
MRARRIDSVLFVDCGEGYEIRSGDRAGQIRWVQQPRARYECLRCQATEGPVAGPAKVAKFVATIRGAHICRSRSHPQAA